MTLPLGYSYSDELIDAEIVKRTAALKRLRQAMAELREAQQFDETLKTPQWQPYAEMILRLIKQAQQEYTNLTGFHDPAVQEKAIRLQSHILTLIQIIALPVNRVSMKDQLHERVLKIKTDILKQFGVIHDA